MNIVLFVMTVTPDKFSASVFICYEGSEVEMGGGVFVKSYAAISGGFDKQAANSTGFRTH